MAKKRSKAWIKRSKAAKRGWATRRKKQALVSELDNKSTLIRNAKKGVGKKVKKKVVVKKLPKKPKRTIEELEALLDLRDKQLEFLKSSKNWVHAMPAEFLHKDGTIALQPSRIRHWGKITNEIFRILKKGYKKGNAEFDRQVAFVAGHFDIPMREVYTLWFSP